MKLALFVLIIVLLGCDKTPDEPQTPGNILTSGPWYLSKTREVKKDSTGQVISDVSGQVDNCLLDKTWFFNKDSSASRDVSCFMTPSPLTGSWSLRADSSIYMFLPFTRCSFATGCIQGNAGIELSKVTEITPASFTVMRSELRQWCPPCHKETHVLYSTFIRK